MAQLIRTTRIGAARRLLAIAGVLALSLTAVVVPATSATETFFNSTVDDAITDDAYNGSFTSMNSDFIEASSIPASHVVTNITVEVDIDHTWLGDLTIKLQSPEGTILALAERPQGDQLNPAGDNGDNSVTTDSSNLSSLFSLAFNDAYAHDPEDMGLGIPDAQTACQHDLRCQFFPNPDQALVAGNSVENFAAFDGELASGDWTLGIGDSDTGDTGTFASWTITIEHQMSRSLIFNSTANLAIADNLYNGTVATMVSNAIDASSIPADHVVTNIMVDVSVSHTWVGDLTIKLRSPGGSILALVERPQGDATTNNAGDNGTDFPFGDSSGLNSSYPLTFSDAYSTDPEQMGLGVVDSSNVCQHDLRCQFFPNPDQALASLANFAAFDGEWASGNWTLFIGDSGPADTGTFVSWSITIDHIAPLTTCASPPFSDVSVDHQFCAEIKWMKVAEVSTGFGDGTYRPNLAVTRQAMSAFMARLAGANLSPCASAPFSDVSTSHQFCTEIKWMKDAGISTGFGDGTYRPNLAVTRQAMSAFMARLADADLTDCTTPPFTDVATTHDFCPEIKWMKDAGISTGFGDDTYRPNLAVTRQAMSAFMYRVSALLP